jgi:hypothetical protein
MRLERSSTERPTTTMVNPMRAKSAASLGPVYGSSSSSSPSPGVVDVVGALVVAVVSAAVVVVDSVVAGAVVVGAVVVGAVVVGSATLVDGAVVIGAEVGGVVTEVVVGPPPSAFTSVTGNRAHDAAPMTKRGTRSHRQAEAQPA